MNEKLMGHLRGFENHYPYKLEKDFARIADKIAELWNNPRIESYFAELLIDDRGNRTGFPADVAREIFVLSVAHDEIRNQRGQETDVWAEEREAAQRAIDELSMKFLPAHMLKAAELSDPSRIALFIKAGMAVDVRDEREWTPLMVAAFNGNEAVARLLITHGANVQARDVGGYTPLHWAALNGFESVIRLLISKGIERNSRSNFGWTALMQAATKGHIAVVRALLDAGDDPKMATDDGWTALHKAVANHHIETVELLLSAGASALARHQDGSTPLSLAQAGRNRELINKLRDGIKARMSQSLLTS
jgi:ankyrin repeat protein